MGENIGAGLRIGIAGVGFIGQVHVRSARLAGAQLTGVSGGSPERTQTTARSLGIDRVFPTSEDLVTSPDVDVVHICTPNQLHEPLARLALENGKHVICEKPLATSREAATELTALADSSGLIAAVPFVYRFHPVVREARSRIESGRTGSLRLIHGTYSQDWLATPEDYNWRIDPALGGASRAFADIGSHWCDLVEFVTGHRIARLSARTITVITERVAGGRESFSSTPTSASARAEVTGDDAVTMMFETDRGASGTLIVSQVSHGRKNRLWFEIDGSKEAIAFDQESPESLWIGTRSGNEIVLRDPATLSPEAAPYAWLPAGHAQGYADCFDAFVADTYKAVRGIQVQGLPAFADGLRAAVLTDTVLASAADLSWKEVS